MLIGIGIDIIEIARVQKAAQKKSFLKKIFTEQELTFFQLQKNPYPSMAAGFAAKEAVVKALGSGFKGVLPTDIEIMHAPGGKPFVRLYGTALERAVQQGIVKIQLSLSHSREYAVANVTAEGGEDSESSQCRANEAN